MKMRVGNMVMDSSGGISFGDAGVAQDAHALSAAPQPPSSDLVAALNRASGALTSGQWNLIATLCIALAVLSGACLLLLAGVGKALGLLLLPSLVAAFAAAMLARRERAFSEEREGSRRALAQERARLILRALSDAEAPETFESIRSQLGWTEAAVLEGLHVAVQNGDLEEDLNLDTGDWVYWPPNRFGINEQQLLPVAERYTLAQEALEQHVLREES